MSQFLVIAGPCVVEERSGWDNCLKVGEVLSDLQSKYPDVKFIFKASFDKANRSSPDAFRGYGRAHGLGALNQVKKRYGLEVITDVHEVSHVKDVADVVDYLQIPAFLCRQTNLIKECCRTGKPVNVKKGQFLSPDQCKGIVDKLEAYGASDYYITERGATFGYNNLVVDYRGFPVIRNFSKVIFDATHSVQTPGSLGGSSGGQREFVYPLAKAAVSVGVDGLFFEVHPDPENAKCDGPNMLQLDDFKEKIIKLIELRRFVNNNEND